MHALRQHRDILLLCLCLNAVLGAVLGQVYLLRLNTLHNNGSWTSTKARIEKSVAGAILYTTSPQSLAKMHLNLGAWHGFQEVLHRDEMSVTELSFAFYLEPNSYVSAIFAKNEKGFAGVRMSESPLFESVYFTADEDGRFERKETLSVRLGADRWHRLSLVLGSNLVEIALDGGTVGRFEQTLPQKQTIGFRGGHRTSLVDDVKIELEDGRVIRESFRNDRSLLAVSMGAFCVVVVVECIVVALLLLVGRTPNRALGLGLATANIVLIFAAGMAWVALYQNAQKYPVVDEAKRLFEEYWIRTAAKTVRERIEKEYSERGPGTTRILFVGSSQTWGAGATTERDTFVHRFEERLNSSSRASENGRRFECINAGISGTTSAQLARFLEDEWVTLDPDVVVINLSNNDTSLAVLETSLKRLIDVSRSKEIAPVLVLEPNSLERLPTDTRHGDLSVKHAVMRRVGEHYDLPVIDMHALMAKRSDEGFLWWDFVHLTDFGHRVFADELYRGLAPRLKKERDVRQRRGLRVGSRTASDAP